MSREDALHEYMRWRRVVSVVEKKLLPKIEVRDVRPKRSPSRVGEARPYLAHRSVKRRDRYDFTRPQVPNLLWRDKCRIFLFQRDNCGDVYPVVPEFGKILRA